MRAGHLTLIPHEFTPPPLTVSVTYKGRRIASANVAVFVKVIQEHFKANPLVQFDAKQIRTEEIPIINRDFA